MDQEFFKLLAQELSQIKWMIAGILVVFILCLAGIAVIIGLIKKTSVTGIVFDDFRDKVSDLLDRNELGEVIRLAEEKLKEYPNNLYAHWFLGQALFLKKEWHKALEEFNFIAEISPSWREDHIDPYVYEIKEKLSNSKPEIVKD